MGSGTIDYKSLPEQKKVFGDKYFFIRPLNLATNKVETIAINGGDEYT